jgi:hypothetical protein
MSFIALRCGVILSLVVCSALIGLGCGPADSGKAAKSSEKKEDKGGLAHNYKGRDWCVEHGMPESICVQCNDKLAKGYKDKGDWCKEHEVPQSQCFQCNLKLKDKFAKEYKEKYGEDPPPMDDDKEKKGDKR